MSTPSPLPDWTRQYFRPGGESAFLFYVVYGHVDPSIGLSRSKYRSEGIPDGLNAMTYSPASHPEVVASFREGYLWERLVGENPDLAASIAAQDSCLILGGEVADPATLNYLRDLVGFLTF